ncbi:diguanylate cyclase [Nevskia ramosa]|uniref:ligand-binding sensor domain-containing diguanylate cyclase n=1 Tax=Nevskia ramosa TaxID=64002 RepID=UPI003D0BE5FE
MLIDRRCRTAAAAAFLWLIAHAWLLFPCTAQAVAVDKSFHNFVRDSWSIEQGLPQIGVLSVAQDAEGYIWAGTLSGMARFDGVNFVNYTPATSPGLPGNQVQTMRLDGAGRLWIGTNKGLAWYRGGRFETVPVENPLASAHLDIQDLLITATGEVLCATSAGLYRVVDGKLQQDRNVPGPLYSIVEADNERWIGGWGGVYRMHGGDPVFEALPGLNLQDSVQHLVRSGSRLWAGTSGGLYLRENGAWRRFDDKGLGSKAIGVLHEDRAGNLWVGTAAGLIRIRDGLVAEQVDNERMGTRWDYLSAFEDREGNLWFGSRTRGLTRLWNGLTTRYSTTEGLNSPLVWAVEHDGAERTWVGTDNGLSLLERGRFRSVVAGGLLPDPNVYSLMVEGDDVWLGTLKGPALLRHGALDDLPLVLRPLVGLRINGILRDRARRLWFATSNGLFRFAGGALTRYGEAEGLTDPSVRLLYQTRDGRLLLGTQNGLGEWLSGAVNMLGGNNGLPAEIDVTAIHELPDRSLVVGVATEQIFVSDGDRWTAFTHDQGLPQNSPFFITDDGRGYLWVAGLRGLYRLPVGDLKPRPGGGQRLLHAEVYGNELAARGTGPRGECCNGAGNSKGFLDRGSIWLPTRDGVLVVPTETMARNPVPPTVRIEAVNAGNGWLSPAQFAAEKLPPRVRDLSFKFSALSFQNPYAVQLQYRLRGYDEDWRSVTDLMSRDADYTNLPPGDYTFEVRGANNAGIWSQVPASLHFAITAKFHETLGFYALLAFSLLLVGYGGHHWQLRALNQRRAVLETIVAQRTDALAVANQQLEKASYTDALTGLRNRRYLQNQLPQDLAFYRRKGPDSYSADHILLFLLVDIDHFKAVNDHYGHGGGDQVLQQFSALLGDLVRVGDYVTRWGGEEFLIVSRPLSREHSMAYATRICSAVSGHSFNAGSDAPLMLSCSVGFSEYPLKGTPAGLDWQDLVELADRAMYHVKETGRDGWAAFCFTPTTPFPQLIERFKQNRAGLLAEDALRMISSRNPPQTIGPGFHT